MMILRKKKKERMFKTKERWLKDKKIKKNTNQSDELTDSDIGELGNA